ncbi:hypothetical protein [Ferruginivarius sediminum]|nr:hypothetical protein [Ferruginivarius sediminum]
MDKYGRVRLWALGCAGFVLALGMEVPGPADGGTAMGLSMPAANADEGGSHSAGGDGARRGPQDGRGRMGGGPGVEPGSHSGGHSGSHLEESVFRGGGHHDEASHEDDSSHEEHESQRPAHAGGGHEDEGHDAGSHEDSDETEHESRRPEHAGGGHEEEET